MHYKHSQTINRQQKKNFNVTTEKQKTLPKWILITSGVFALMEIGVSLSIFFSPHSFADKIDLDAKGVDFLMYMWATRQFALGFIFAIAIIKKSSQMLTLSFIFFLVMFIGDLVVGILLKDNTLVISAIVMCLIASTLSSFINNKYN